MALYLSEGCILQNHDEHYPIYISQSTNGKARKQIFDTLTKLGEFIHIKFKYNNKEFKFGNKQLYYYLKQFGKSHNKFIPSEIKNSNKEILKEFLYYYALGDGNITGSYYDIFTVSKRMADDLQEIAIKCGFHACVRHSVEKRGYNVYIGTSISYSHDRQGVLEKIKFNGFVYDVTLEKNHLLYVRRNEKGCWSSNSGQEDKLGNFRRCSKLADVPIEKVWMTYFCKHFDALSSYIRGEYKDSEPIDGRIQDLINYLFLLYGILHEKDSK